MENISLQMIGGADGPTSVFLAGILNTQVLIAIVVIGILLCIFGLRLMRILSALVGFTLGVGIGAAICMISGMSGAVAIAIIVAPGVILAILSAVLRKVGVFVSVFCYIFSAISSIVPSSSLIVLIIGIVVGVVAAILAVKYMEPAVVIASALAGGLLAGPAITELAGLSDKVWIGYVIALVLAMLGIFVQLFIHARTEGKREKIYSKKVKEMDSMESEVEKARMLLDEEDI